MFARSQLLLTLIACLVCLVLARPEKKGFNKRQAIDINLTAATTVTASATVTASSTKPTAAPSKAPVKAAGGDSKFVFTYSLKDTTPLADGRVYFSLWPSMAASSRSSRSAEKASSKSARKAASKAAKSRSKALQSNNNN